MTAQPKPRTIPFNVLCKYPFLNESISWIQEKNITPIEGLYKRITILEKIKTLFTDALDNKEKTEGIGYSDDEGLFIYPWVRIFLSFINQPRLTHKMANLLSKHFSNLLDHDDDFTVGSVARDQGINVTQLHDDKVLMFNSVEIPYRLPFLEYLAVAAPFKSKDWKLVNKLLHNGFVYLRKQDLARIIEERIKLKLIEPNTAASDEALKDAFNNDPLVHPTYESIVQLTHSRIASTSVENLPVDDSCFPPCINAILEKNTKGINLTHSERLFLVTFLLTIGRTVDEVLSLFRSQPDYNEKISRYQVEFSAGKHGKGKKYTPSGCVSLESINVCKKDDPRFGSKYCIEPKTPFKNPLQFYNRKMWLKAKKASEAAGVQVDDDNPSVDHARPGSDAIGDSNSQKT